MNDDLFSSSGNNKSKKDTYTAQNIEVLDWSEAVRLRPGMYIGGKDINALHHIVAEVFDNAMDEAVAGHASKITIQLFEGNIIKISDNGRGIPIDPHPKFPDKSALEVILTTLHSGGKFDNKSYETSGGLHGVGISVVNALSDELMVEVVRDGKLYKQNYSKGKPITELTELGKVNIKQGTFITFHPDPEIFGRYLNFKPKRLYNFAKSKAYLFQGVKIHWECDKSLLEGDDETPAKEVIYFPHGLQDYLNSNLSSEDSVTKEIFAGIGKFHDSIGKVEWAIGWKLNDEGFSYSYCNTILTPQGGTHEAGFKAGLLKSLKNYGDMTGNKKVAQINVDDLVSNACIILSIFIQNPQFQGQTKEKLLNSEASKLVENVIKDRFDHWLSSNKTAAELLLNFVIEKAEDRRKRKVEKEVNRKSLTHRIILPGKLADCKISTALGTELFIVEGDSAGGSAKQARNRENQAILPLRGKILNVANATSDKIISNQQLQDLTQALGCGTRKNYSEANLRYEKIIIMTDADVDGAHIASLLMTYFFIQMPKLVENGHLYLAKPPLYRLTQNNKTYYANDDKHKDEMVAKLSKGKGKIDIGRFKGLGEMTAAQLKETTMDPKNRNLIKMLDLFGYVFDQVKKEYVEEVQDKEIIESAINGMLTSLDPHSGYLNEKAFNEMKMQTKGEFGGLGIEVTMDNGLIKVISPIDDTPAFNAGIKTGDYIFAIDNEAIHGMSLPEAVEKMRGRSGTKIHLSILREGRSEPLELTLNRAVIKIKSVKSRVEGDIGYIRINTFSEQTANGVRLEFEKIKQQIGKNLKGLVLDLRNNPGGLLDQAVAVVDLFLDGGEIVSTRGRGEGSISRYNAHKGSIIGSLPTVILINGGSASASEIVAGALQDHKKAIIMGTKSFGKGSVQIVKPLPPGHGAMRITNARYYTPSGRSIQAEGIIPDIIVEPGKLELAQSTKENKRLLSEASLKGHLKNKDKQNKENEEDVSDNITKDEKKPLSKSDEQAIYDKDYQLARAIDLIKGLYLFNHKKVKAN